MIKAVIFDLDGVLVDATEWHYDALNQALNLFGYTITRAEHQTIYNGLPTAKKLEMMSERVGLPRGLHPIIQHMKRQFTDEKVRTQCHPDYQKQIMLAQLQRHGYALACCSNAQKYSVLNMLQRAQIDNYFSLILGNDEGLPAKPQPDVYLHAFKQLGIQPQQACIVEDAPHGVQAAKASGAKVLAVKGYEDVTLDLCISAGLIS